MRLFFVLGLIASAAVAEETPEVTAPVAEKNEVSVHGAPTLGQWNRGQSLVIGFPLMTLKASIGLLERLDFGVGIETYYFLTLELLAFIKLGLVRGTNWSFSLAAEGEGSFFATPGAAETRGARWLTGHRNYSVSPQAILTYRATDRSPRLFAQVDYLLTFDLESPTLLGHNVRTHLGAELPLSPKASFVVIFGLSVHGRPEDSLIMPSGQLGLVTGF